MRFYKYLIISNRKIVISKIRLYVNKAIKFEKKKNKGVIKWSK